MSCSYLERLLRQASRPLDLAELPGGLSGISKEIGPTVVRVDGLALPGLVELDQRALWIPLDLEEDLAGEVKGVEPVDVERPDSCRGPSRCGPIANLEVGSHGQAVGRGIFRPQYDELVGIHR